MSEFSPLGGNEGYGGCDDEMALKSQTGRVKFHIESGKRTLFSSLQCLPGQWSRRAPTKKRGGQVKKSKKSPVTLREELLDLLDQDGNRRQMLLAVVEKAIGGDMKAFEVIREILEENQSPEDPGLTIKLGPGMEELSQ